MFQVVCNGNILPQRFPTKGEAQAHIDKQVKNQLHATKVVFSSGEDETTLRALWNIVQI